MWWVITDQKTQPGHTSLTVLATTNVADHLFMAWQYFAPTRVTIWRTIRGQRIHCGYQWRWDNPFLTEQLQHGDTTYHTLHNAGLNPASTIWFYLFAPGGPYDREIQGPLTTVTLPYMPGWTTPIYIATRAKGVYYTPLFTPPGGPQPIWTPVNQGLHSLATWQICPDKLDPATRHYLLTGEGVNRILYIREPATSPAWRSILTADQVSDLLPFPETVYLKSVDTNIHHPGHLYALFDTAAVRQLWCIHSHDYGETWALALIDPLFHNYAPANLQAANTIHAAIYNLTTDLTHIYTSLDLGLTWLPSPGIPSIGWGTKLQVDPLNEAIVYTGIQIDATNTHELYRQTAYLGALAQVDGPLHLGPWQTDHVSPPWIDPTDNTFLRTLQNRHIYTTTNYCASWTDHGPTQYRVHLLAQLPTYPDRLYLTPSHVFEAPGPPNTYHTLFISINNALTMYGKAGNHPHLPNGGEDSIPWDCQGAAQAGIMFAP